ncbi:MAG: hypothetical protein U9O64_01260 [Campylobacterota bacterium]|nr:hypothetical protein [Campylobacterota bacterium]
MVSKNNYKKELYSLPIEVVDELVAYAKETHQKKSRIVAEAIEEYIAKREKQKLKKEVKSLMGIVKGNVSDIQDIKANWDV